MTYNKVLGSLFVVNPLIMILLLVLLMFQIFQILSGNFETHVHPIHGRALGIFRKSKQTEENYDCRKMVWEGLDG